MQNHIPRQQYHTQNKYWIWMSVAHRECVCTAETMCILVSWIFIHLYFVIRKMRNFSILLQYKNKLAPVVLKDKYKHLRYNTLTNVLYRHWKLSQLTNVIWLTLNNSIKFALGIRMKSSGLPTWSLQDTTDYR